MFEYKNIKPEDIDMILLDASPNKKVLKELQYVLKEKAFAEGWSVNKETGEYLFYVPSFVRTAVATFFLYFKRQFYEIKCPLFNNSAFFSRFPEDSVSMRLEIQRAASEAIAVNKYYVTFSNEPEDYFNITKEERIKRMPIFVQDDINCN